MAINTALPIYTTITLASVSFANSDGTTAKTLVPSQSGPQRIDGLVISSNDSAAGTVNFFENDGTSDHFLGSIGVPAGSGYTTGRVNALSTIAPGGVGAIVLPGGYSLKCAMAAAVTSGDTCTVVASGGIF